MARAGVVLTLTSPLVWFNASRPMSDLPGLALALAAQALLATAFVRQGEDRRARAAGAGVGGEALARSGRLIVLGALLAGLALGMRSQTAWLTLPLAAVVLADRAGQDAKGALVGGGMAFGLGVLAWLVPLIVASGGPVRYLAALSSQAGEDLAGVDMFATNPTPRRMAFGLLHTFVQPWASVPLAIAVIVLAVAGALLLLRRGRRELLLLAAITVPYGVFHLVFQETVTTRYVLPLVPAMALLAAVALGGAGRLALIAGTAVLSAIGLIVTVPALADYARQGSPLSRAIGAMAGRSASPPPAVAMHHSFARALRGETAVANALPSPVKHEWLEVERVLEKDRRRVVWFLTDPRRTDLALFDEAGRRLQESYRWPFDAAAFIGGVRPSDVDLWEIVAPGWMAGEGWALTPETAGVATLDRRGPLRAPITAAVARRPEPARLLIGGRHLGQSGEPPLEFVVDLDGRPLDRWTAPPGFFLRTIDVPAGALTGAGDWARLTVAARPPAGAAGTAGAAIEQFDLQSGADALMLGFDDGWHEQEYSFVQGRAWRWTSEAATLRILAGPEVRQVSLQIQAESPLRYFDGAPEVVLRAGGRELSRMTPTHDFVLAADVPADALEASGGVVTLATSRTFVPADRGDVGDHRRLGLRVFTVQATRSVAPLR